MTAVIHGLYSPEERLLSAIERRQELDRLEHKDRWTPADFQRARDLADGRVTVPVPSASQMVDELTRLRGISRDQWAKIKRCVFALRQARAAHQLDGTLTSKRRVQALRQDAGWQIDAFAATRRRIGEVDAALSGRQAVE